MWQSCVYIYVLLIHSYIHCERESSLSMGKREYNDARKAANARYIAEKTDRIQAYLPVGYAAKVQELAEKAGTSKAQILKNAIDMLYSAMMDEQPTEQE